MGYGTIFGFQYLAGLGAIRHFGSLTDYVYMNVIREKKTRILSMSHTDCLFLGIQK